jgi:histidinol-phosphate aminotransferase
MRNYTHDLDAMRAAIRPDTRLVFVANPNNPTGTVVDNRALERFLDRLPDTVIAVLDEAYIELLPPEQQPDTLQWVRERRKVVVLRTFSKTYGLAGLRVGYAVAPEACVQLLHRVRQPFNVNAMALAAAEAALDDDAFVRRTRRLVAEGLAFFSAAFERLKLKYVPSSANFILVEVGRGRDVFQGLEREGVIVRPMDPYGLPDHIRITVGTRAENRRCLRALERVLKARTATGGKG